MRTIRLYACIIIAIALLAAGCGSIDRSSSSAPNEVETFLSAMKKNASENNRRNLVSMVRLPLRTHFGPKKVYTDEDSLLKDYDRIFSPRVLSAIANARYEDLFVNYQGMMIGHGEIWFDSLDGTIQIKAVNP